MMNEKIQWDPERNACIVGTFLGEIEQIGIGVYFMTPMCLVELTERFTTEKSSSSSSIEVQKPN